MAILKNLGIFGSGFVSAIIAVTVVAPFFERHSKPYAGQNERLVSSLSADDISQLTDGAGWGLAKPAELNGFPGPAHVLELADELKLSESQKSRITIIFENMKSAAKETGLAYIDAESELDAAYKQNLIDKNLLEALLETAEKRRAQLRNIHLAAHLDTTPILNDAQKEKYQSLRGYNSNHDGGHNGH